MTTTSLHDPAGEPRQACLDLLREGTFTLGCNYWASHAGTAMWRDWNPEVVRADLANLAAHGLQVLRVFPLWPDFQPIVQLRGGGGAPMEIRLGEDPLPFDPIGQAGVSALMLERFAEFCVLAEKAGLKLIVGLVTGWMSGRLFVPPALEGRDPITDPVSLAWQIKFVRAFVSRLGNQAAVVAWDLGNECNCMGNAPSRESAYLWTAGIAHAIRAVDASRPIVSGMHSLGSAVGPAGNPWRIDDQAELVDLLTTHPYPYWCRHTRTDSVAALRTSLHATAETRFYADIGGKPCFAEEIGTMGPMVASDGVSAAFARVNLFSLWANDCRGFFWWCAHDQTELAHAPYDWNGVEVELGLLRNDGAAKPVLHEMAAFRRFLGGLPFSVLPRRCRDAVCLLTQNQDDWAVAFGAHVLAKQARVEIEFRHIRQAIPEAGLYFLPCLSGPNCLPRHQWLALLDRVKRGATLYLSLGDGIVPHFNEVAGVELITRAAPARPLVARLSTGEELPLSGGDDLVFEARGAEVLATRTDNGSPAFWRHRLGSGMVFVYAAPLEASLTTSPRIFEQDAPPCWRIYHEVARGCRAPRAFLIESPFLAVTEHSLSDGRVVVVVINHSDSAKTVAAHFSPGFHLADVWRGSVLLDGETSSALTMRLPPKEAAVFGLRREA